MAFTYLEQRAAPLGNSFLQCSEPTLVCDSLSKQVLKQTWGFKRVVASRLRRHHSVGGFVPYAMAALPEPNLAVAKMEKGVALRRKTTTAKVVDTTSDSDTSDTPWSSQGSTCAPIDISPSSNTVIAESEFHGDSDIQEPARFADFEPKTCARPAVVSVPEKAADTTHGTRSSPEQATGSSTSSQMVTTMMIRNLPHSATQALLLEELDEDGFDGLYDFVYLPASFDAKQGKGYAFVNFSTEEAAQAFGDRWHKSRHCGVRGTLLNISPAALQGFEANVKKLAGPRMARIRNPALRPFVRGERKVGQQTRVRPLR